MLGISLCILSTWPLSLSPEFEEPQENQKKENEGEWQQLAHGLNLHTEPIDHKSHAWQSNLEKEGFAKLTVPGDTVHHGGEGGGGGGWGQEGIGHMATIVRNQRQTGAGAQLALSFYLV